MSEQQGFAIWLTGLPASGKSSLTRELVKQLHARGVTAVVLESDAMRKILTPEPTYSEKERDRFYRTLALIGELITRSGTNVVFDATANKQEYRDRARRLINKFLEVYVACPLEVCAKRDPKGIYAQAALKKTTTVPGLQAVYEPPLKPDLTLDGQAPPETGSVLVLDKLKQLLYI
jgi:adenylylsulfate kinase